MEKIDNFVDFDAKVDKFLRHQMTEDEEVLFKSELHSDQEKMGRARTIALTIRSMQKEGIKHDQMIVDKIGGMNEFQFRKDVGLSPKKINLRSYFFRYLVAASVAIAFFLGGYQYYGHNQIVTLGNNYYSTYTLDYAETMHIRGVEDEAKLQMLATVFDKVRDNIDIYSQKASHISELRLEKSGFVYQDFMLIDELNVYDNIILPKRLLKDKNDVNVLRIINDLKLNNLLKKYPTVLSGGEKQRVAIARSLVNKPKILFCDEPTGSLDYQTTKEIMDLLAHINKEYQITIVMVTHELENLAYASRIIKYSNGTLICD